MCIKSVFESINSIKNDIVRKAIPHVYDTITEKILPQFALASEPVEKWDGSTASASPPLSSLPLSSSFPPPSSPLPSPSPSAPLPSPPLRSRPP